MRFKGFVLEMATITKKGKKVLADGSPLKSTSFDALDKNILIYHEKNGNILWPKGKVFVWFADNDEYRGKLESGEYDLLMFPVRHRFNMFTVLPLKDVWKAKHLNKYRGSKELIGMVEAQVEGDTVWVEMMSVKPTHQRNSANALMLRALREHFPDKTVGYEDLTADGVEFVKANDPEAPVRWTNSYRPKGWVEKES